jgi:hypothetical protein
MVLLNHTMNDFNMNWKNPLDGIEKNFAGASG